MNLKKLFNEWNPFRSAYIEKDAIRGHSVDWYNYAIQLLNEGSDESLIKAYAWLVLVSEHTDRDESAKLILHKLGFELKQRDIFNLAIETSTLYMRQYSSEAVRKRAFTGNKPSDYLNRFLFCIMDFMIYQINFFDFVRNKGNLRTWIFITAGGWFALVGSFILWLKNVSILTSSFLVLSMFFSILFFSIVEIRMEEKNINKSDDHDY